MSPLLTRKQKDILAMSKAEYSSHIGDGEEDIKLQVSAAIFRKDAHSSRPTILLLKRKTHGSRGPGVFEVPTGRVYDSDFIISDSIARAVERQASLKVFRIEAMLRENKRIDKHFSLDDNDELTFVGPRKHVRLNWAVAVNTEDVVLGSGEHEEYVWASWNALGMLDLRDDMRDLAKEALTWAARCLF